jgi:hypothetical protein
MGNCWLLLTINCKPITWCFPLREDNSAEVTDIKNKSHDNDGFLILDNRKFNRAIYCQG